MVPGAPSADSVPAAAAVLGGSGLLGVHALEAVLAAARRASPSPRPAAVVSISRDPGAVPAGASAVRADALRPGDLERALAAAQPERVLVCTALSRGGDCEAYPELARALNVELPRRVARWCREHGSRLVHVSTDLVFGAEDAPSGGFREEAPPGPLTRYGESKAEGELALLAECPEALVVRLPLLYGDSRGRGLGASDSLLAAIARGERPTLYSDEWRTPLEVSGAARALAELLFADSERARGLLHVAGTERLSRLELGLAVLRAAGHGEARALSLVEARTRAEAGQDRARPRDASLNCERALALLSFAPSGASQSLAGRAR